MGSDGGWKREGKEKKRRGYETRAIYVPHRHRIYVCNEATIDVRGRAGWKIKKERKKERQEEWRRGKERKTESRCMQETKKIKINDDDR